MMKLMEAMESPAMMKLIKVMKLPVKMKMMGVKILTLSMKMVERKKQMKKISEYQQYNREKTSIEVKRK